MLNIHEIARESTRRLFMLLNVLSNLTRRLLIPLPSRELSRQVNRRSSKQQLLGFVMRGNRGRDEREF